MNDDLRAAIDALQNAGDDARAQQAFGELTHIVRREPAECAAELSRAILAEGGLRTPRLLTLLGMTREPAPECVSLCLDLLRSGANSSPPLPTDATLGAATIVARVKPGALLPNITAGAVSDREIMQVLPLLLAISSTFLAQLPDSAVTEMARWLWHDCASHDLMIVSDLVGWHVQESGADDPLVDLMADLVERVPVSAGQKNYAGQCLKQAGVSADVVEQLQNAHRAIRVAPASEHDKPLTIADPEPPPPDPRADEWLAMFSEDDEQTRELARAGIDQLFETTPRLASWVAMTVDALPSWRRREDIDWALVQTSVWRDDERTAIPPSVLQRWLDTPQLLTSNGTIIALDLLGRQQPRVIAQRYLHRAVAASSDGYAEISMGGLWRALVTTEPATALAVLSRWIAFGFGQNDFLVYLVQLLTQCLREQPELLDTLAKSLVATPDMPENAIDVARNVLKQLQENPGA